MRCIALISAVIDYDDDPVFTFFVGKELFVLTDSFVIEVLVQFTLYTDNISFEFVAARFCYGLVANIS